MCGLWCVVCQWASGSDVGKMVVEKENNYLISIDQARRFVPFMHHSQSQSIVKQPRAGFGRRTLRQDRFRSQWWPKVIRTEPIPSLGPCDKASEGGWCGFDGGHTKPRIPRRLPRSAFGFVSAMSNGALDGYWHDSPALMWG